MEELYMIGLAILAGIATFAVILRRSGGECVP